MQVADIRRISEQWQADPKSISDDIQFLKGSIENAFESHPSGHGFQWKAMVEVPKWVDDAISFEDQLPPRAIISLIWIDFLRAYADLITSPQICAPRAKEFSEALTQLADILASLAVVACRESPKFPKYVSRPPATSPNLELHLAPRLANLQRELELHAASQALPARSTIVTSPTSSAVGKPPATKHLQAYVLCRIMGKSQEYAAKHCFSNQGTVSRWVSKVERFLSAGGNCPELPELISRLRSLDPSQLELGKRQDGMAKTAIPKKSDD